MTARGSILLLILLLASGAGLAWFWQQGASDSLGLQPSGHGATGPALINTADEANLVLTAGNGPGVAD